MIQFEKLGIFLSKPIAFLLVLIYFVQSGLLVYLIADKFSLEKQISFQQKRINELEERLQIFGQFGVFIQQLLLIRRCFHFHSLQVIGDDFVKTLPIRRILAPTAAHASPPAAVDARVRGLTDRTVIRYLAKRR